MYQIELLDFEELSEQEQLEHYTNRREFITYLRIKHNGKTVRLETDFMEPEDVFFWRELGWVPEALREAYRLGLDDGKSTEKNEMEKTKVPVDEEQRKNEEPDYDLDDEDCLCTKVPVDKKEVFPEWIEGAISLAWKCVALKQNLFREDGLNFFLNPAFHLYSITHKENKYR